MFETAAAQDMVFLMGAPRRGTVEIETAEEHLDELARLAETAGGEVVGRAIQRIRAPNPHSYIGKGKLEELKGAVAAVGANLLLFDEELSPSQGKTMEEVLEIRVMDRTELILDIFATRARTAEAKLQVELAQLEYLLPRLARMWAHLSRIRGGIGLRGPGETQIETDRRLIRTRISVLRKRLKQVAAHRGRLGSRSSGALTAALVGYTNAGKSSLMRALTGADAFVEDRLFATLDTLTREFVVDGARIRLVDTVGFIRKLPHDLVESFKSTLEVVLRADILLHVVDASDPAFDEHLEAANAVLSELGIGDKTQVMVFNKMDLVGEDGEELRLRAIELPERCVYVSALSGDVAELRRCLRDLTRRRSTAG